MQSGRGLVEELGVPREELLRPLCKDTALCFELPGTASGITGGAVNILRCLGSRHRSVDVGVAGHLDSLAISCCSQSSGDRGTAVDVLLSGVLPTSSLLYGVGGAPEDFADFGVMTKTSSDCRIFLLLDGSFSDLLLVVRTISGKNGGLPGLFFAGEITKGCRVTRLCLRFWNDPMPVRRQGTEEERDFSKLPICPC